MMEGLGLEEGEGEGERGEGGGQRVYDGGGCIVSV